MVAANIGSAGRPWSPLAVLGVPIGIGVSTSIAFVFAVQRAAAGPSTDTGALVAAGAMAAIVTGPLVSIALRIDRWRRARIAGAALRGAHLVAGRYGWQGFEGRGTVAQRAVHAILSPTTRFGPWSIELSIAADVAARITISAAPAVHPPSVAPLHIVGGDAGWTASVLADGPTTTAALALVLSQGAEKRGVQVVPGAVIFSVSELPLHEITPVFILEALRALATVAAAAERGPRWSASSHVTPYHVAAQAQRHREATLLLYIGAVALFVLTAWMVLLPLIEGR